MNKVFSPIVTPEEIQQAQDALKIQGKFKLTKQNLDLLFEKIRGIEETNIEPMLLSGQDPEDNLQSQQVNSYVFLLMYNFINKHSFLEQIMQHFENDPKLQNIGSVIRYNEQFGQVYAVVIVTHLIQTFPDRTIELFMRNNFINQFVDLIEHNYFSQYEIQLIDLTFQHLDNKDIELSKQTKEQLIEMVQRQFQQKALQGSDYLCIYLRNLKTLILNDGFKEQIIKVNTIQTIAIYLSALFFQRWNVSQKLDFTKDELEQIHILTQLISKIFTLISDIENDVEQAEQFEKAMLTIQELDILRIFQELSNIDQLKSIIASFFGNNAKSRNFSMAVVNRFEEKDDVKSVCDFAYMLLYNSKDIEIQQDVLNFLAGVCIDNQMLLKFVENAALLHSISQIIKQRLISYSEDKFVDSTVSLLKVIFRSPQLFIDYSSLDFTQKEVSQLSIFANQAGASILSNDYFTLVLDLCHKYPVQEQYVEILYFVSQLRVNMMPFVHQVSTLQLLRKKFQVCTEIDRLPEPSQEEIQAFIVLLKYPNMKLAGIVPFALYQFLRYDNKCKYIVGNRKQIVKNLEVMVQNLSKLNEHMIKNSSLRKAKMGQATRDAIREALNLLCVLSKDIKDRESIVSLGKIFEKWTTIAQINQQYAQETVKYIAFILKNSGKQLKLETEKIQQIQLIQTKLDE